MPYDINNFRGGSPHDEASISDNHRRYNEQPIQQKIAVIGSGISGLSAAWGLSKTHEVTLFEKDSRPGGHSHTVDINLDGRVIPVDTGFIVYNEENYPNLVALFDHLGVETTESDMSFGASVQEGDCEYSGQALASVFATRKNIVSPGFLRMLVDVSRFHRVSRRVLKAGVPDELTLRDYFARHKFSDRFLQDFIIPMAGAIWSAPTEQILDYPAKSFLLFYHNHGLLQVLNMPVWRTVRNGSRNYVQKLLQDFSGDVRLNATISSVTRVDNGVIVNVEADQNEKFDQVVFATHGDTAFKILTNLNEEEKSVLGAFHYMPNRAVLHTDANHMPNKRQAWSAWNVLRRGENVSLTYWMNKLQPLGIHKDIFVTLNPVGHVANVLGEYEYDHPLFNLDAIAAQKNIWSLQGNGGVWYCGAHMGSGFHEDGLQSGLAVAEAIDGFRRPWNVDNESGRIFLPGTLISDESISRG